MLGRVSGKAIDRRRVLSELEMALPQTAKGKKEKAQEGAVGR
jgi:hypothetical protein